MDCRIKEEVVITGGNGFIGRHLSKYLQKKFGVISLNSETIDVTSIQDIELLDGKNIKHIVHLAGKTFVPESWEKPHAFFETNILGTLNILEYCRKNKTDMTYISAYTYGNVGSNPIAEITEAHPNNPYAESKYIAEELCRFYFQYFDVNITVLRLFNVYGAGQSDKFLIPYIIKQAKGDSDNIYVQNLQSQRDYVYIDDVCRAIEISIEKTKGFHMFNVASGRAYSVKEVIEYVQSILKIDKPVICKKFIRKNEINNVVADIGLIEKEWNWVPKFTLENGLKKYLEELK